jgi:hypothetical protein
LWSQERAPKVRHPVGPHSENQTLETMKCPKAETAAELDAPPSRHPRQSF